MFCSYRQDSESGFQANTTTFKITNARNISTLIETQNRCQQKCEETKMQSVCFIYAITVTRKFGITSSSAKCNAKVYIGHNYQVMIITRFIFTNPIKCDVYLVYFICINNQVISMQLTLNNATSISWGGYSKVLRLP